LPERRVFEYSLKFVQFEVGFSSEAIKARSAEPFSGLRLSDTTATKVKGLPQTSEVMQSPVEVLATSRRLRVLLAILIIVLPVAALGAPAPSEFYRLVRIDYAFWASVVLAFLLLAADMKAYRGASMSSTLLVEVAGLEVAAICRVATYILSVASSEPQNVVVGLGGGLKTSLLPLVYIALSGLAAIALPSIASAARGAPIVFGSSITADVFLSILSTYLRAFLRHRRLTAFLIGFLVRLLPEVSWWPWQ